MSYERLLNKAVVPTEKEIEKHVASKINLWSEIHVYMNQYYDFKPELSFFTKKYGWSVRYKKSGKTLCYFFPEKDAFSILIVLGQKESDKVEIQRESMSQSILHIFDTTEQLRDGRWLWLRILEKQDLESFKIILSAKRKPKVL